MQFDGFTQLYENYSVLEHVILTLFVSLYLFFYERLFY